MLRLPKPIATVLAIFLMLQASHADETTSDAAEKKQPIFIIKNVAPHYPRASYENLESGTVRIRLRVTPDGKVSKVALLESSGFKRLDDTALLAVFDMKFNSITHIGATEDRLAIIPIIFKAPAIDANGYALVFDYVHYPYISRLMQHKGEVTLKLKITESGTSSDVALVRSSGHSALDKAALKSAIKWRFKRMPIQKMTPDQWHYMEVDFQDYPIIKHIPYWPEPESQPVAPPLDSLDKN